MGHCGDAELDPRLPAVYDAENVWAADDDFFLDAVRRRQPARVLDLGCGTGRLTTAIVNAGFPVVGVDPNHAALIRAREKPGGSDVAWVTGMAACLGAGVFDAALMTSHVAQVFLSDAEWAVTLYDLRRSLKPGGLLAFDTRDPRARSWESWTRAGTHGFLALPEGSVEGWMDVRDVDGEVVTFAWENVFPDGSHLAGSSRLRFRSEELIRRTLASTGFDNIEVYGGWQGEPPGAGVGEFVVTCLAR